MRIAVLVATRDEERHITQRIANIQACKVPEGASVNLHILDNGSTDRTRECGRAAPHSGVDVILHEFDAIGKCASLFRGFEKIEADLFVLSDANTVFAEDTLIHFAAAHQGNPRATVFVGNIRNVRLEHDGEAFLRSGGRLPWRLRLEGLLGLFSGANGGCYAVTTAGVSGIWQHPPVRNDDFVISVFAASRGSVIQVHEAKAYEIEHLSLRDAYSSKYRDALGHHRALTWIWENVPARGGKLAVLTRVTIWFAIPLIAAVTLSRCPETISILGLVIIILLPKTRLTIFRMIALFAGYFVGACKAPPPTWQPTR